MDNRRSKTNELYYKTMSIIYFFQDLLKVFNGIVHDIITYFAVVFRFNSPVFSALYRRLSYGVDFEHMINAIRRCYHDDSVRIVRSGPEKPMGKINSLSFCGSSPRE